MDSRIKLIQPSEMGVVWAIHVQDGDRVKAGDVLINLDPTDSTADKEHIRCDLLAARMDVARASALLEADDSLKVFAPQEGAAPPMARRQFRLVRKDGRSMALALWAEVSEEVDHRLSIEVPQP